MSEDSPPTPREAYRRFIDECVNQTPGVTAQRIVEHGHVAPYPQDEFPEQIEYNELVASLEPKQREVLARLCNSERQNAMHDVLACLTWWLDCGGISMQFNNEPLPVDESGMGLHGDFVGRSQGWDWPSDD